MVNNQLDAMRDHLTLANSIEWIGPTFWYSYIDRGGLTRNAENWFGLIRPDGAKKPAYAEFANRSKKPNKKRRWFDWFRW